MSGPIRPLALILTRHAERELLGITPDDVRHRVMRDIEALAKGQIPFRQLKKLHAFEPPVWQLTSGHFRVLYRRVEEQLLILRVVPKSAQAKTFRGMR